MMIHWERLRKRGACVHALHEQNFSNAAEDAASKSYDTRKMDTTTSFGSLGVVSDDDTIASAMIRHSTRLGIS